MLGGSIQIVNLDIARCLVKVQPKTVLEYGCGAGKLAFLLEKLQIRPNELTAIQKLFSDGDRETLLQKGYTDIIDDDIMAYLKRGIERHYDLIVGMDVIEHFFLGEAMSIIDYSLYNCDWFLLVWPSKYPQNMRDVAMPGNLHVTNILDVHRSSFELSDIASRYDVVYYNQVSLSDNSTLMRLHLALIRGHMNTKPIFPQVGYQE